MSAHAINHQHAVAQRKRRSRPDWRPLRSHGHRKLGLGRERVRVASSVWTEETQPQRSCGTVDEGRRSRKRPHSRTHQQGPGNNRGAVRAMLSEAGHALVHSTPADGPLRGSVRTCVGCRKRADRSVLLRVAAVEVDGNWCVVPDPRHRLPGRGASLHPDLGCLELAERRQAFTRALRRGGPLEASAVREYVAASTQACPPDTSS